MQDVNDAIPTVSGVEIAAEAAATAAALAALVREVTRNLPFGAEPADFPVMLERLAAEEAEE